MLTSSWVWRRAREVRSHWEAFLGCLQRGGGKQCSGELLQGRWIHDCTMRCFDGRLIDSAYEADAAVLLQKLESVSQESSCGQEFTLQSMQASDAEKSTAVPFTLVFRCAMG